MARYLSPKAARRFYDFVGRHEDAQAFYEDPALDVLRREGGFARAAHVFEFGCGTGRLAESLLSGPLGENARYTACDISPKMVTLASARLARFGSRVAVWQSGAKPDFTSTEPPPDRIVTTYVLDLLAPDKITDVIAAAHAALSPGGRFCVTSITPGTGFPAVFVSGIWGGLHRLSPLLVGGCRPIRLAKFFPAADWSLAHDSTVSRWGVTSEIVIAIPT